MIEEERSHKLEKAKRTGKGRRRHEEAWMQSHTDTQKRKYSRTLLLQDRVPAPKAVPGTWVLSRR